MGKFEQKQNDLEYSLLEFQQSLRGLLSSSCRGLGPFGPKGDFAGRTARRTDERTTGLRELDVFPGYRVFGRNVWIKNGWVLVRLFLSFKFISIKNINKTSMHLMVSILKSHETDKLNRRNVGLILQSYYCRVLMKQYSNLNLWVIIWFLILLSLLTFFNFQM